MERKPGTQIVCGVEIPPEQRSPLVEAMLRVIDELAAELGVVLGRDVKAQAIPREAWAGALEHMGLPKGGTWAYEEMIEGVNSGWIGIGVENTEHVAGRTSAREVFAAAKAAN